MIWQWAFPRLPLLTWAVVYCATCYVGALALLFSVRFRALYLIFAGADFPDLTWRNLGIVITLVTLAPLLLWFGYELAIRRTQRLSVDTRNAFGSEPLVPAWVARVMFGASVAFGVGSLVRAGGLERSLVAWFDYNAYVYARWHLFDRLTFFEFVNLYTLLPLFGGYLFLTEGGWLGRVASLAVVATLQYPLAQKKALLTSAIMIGSAWYIWTRLGTMPRRPGSARTHVNRLFVAPACLYVVYLGLTMAPVMRRDSARFQTIASLVPQEQVKEAQERSRRRRQLRASSANGPWLEQIAIAPDLDADYPTIVNNRAVVLYALMSSFNRTSISAIVYPVVFPAEHAFFPVDLGLDIFRFGKMPDDNLIVYRFLWPMHHRGAIGAPFHVVLYSQGGVLISLVGSLLVGALLAGCWWRIVCAARPDVVTSLFGGLIITFSAFLAIDSVRNSVVVSYGVIWGVLALASVLGLAHLIESVRTRAVARVSP